MEKNMSKMTGGRDNTLEEIADVILSSKSCAVFSHYRPDGDALGSGMALTLALRNSGRKADFFCQEDDPPTEENRMPERFSYLYNFSNVNFGLKDVMDPSKQFNPEKYDTLITVDVSEIRRQGSMWKLFASFGGNTINIDHHVSNIRFAKYNYVGNNPASCEILPHIFDLCQFEITKEIAEFLVCGIMTDTGNLTHDDVGVYTYEVMTRLKKIGVDITRDYYELMQKKSVHRAYLYGRVISRLRLEDKGRIGIVVTTLEDLKATEAGHDDTSGIVDFPLCVEGVLVSVSLMEQVPGVWRVSFRSRGAYDVNVVAGKFGGGGHENASGCMIKLKDRHVDFEGMIAEIIDAIRGVL